MIYEAVMATYITDTVISVIIRENKNYTYAYVSMFPGTINFWYIAINKWSDYARGIHRKYIESTCLVSYSHLSCPPL